MENETSKSVPGFRSFWEKSKKEAAQRNLTFVQVEHGKRTKHSRKRRLAGKSATNAEQQTVQSESPQDSGRRLQVYQAQRRHRNRKAEYGKTLKDERAQLEHLIAMTRSETEQLSVNNGSIGALLLAHGIDPRYHISMPPSALEQRRSGTPKKAYSVASEARLSEAVKEIVESAFDGTCDPRVAECRTLLLKDIEPYGSDEDREENAWIESADQILNDG